jgi:peptidoglycan hydrolase CwlO-like protein
VNSAPFKPTPGRRLARRPLLLAAIAAIALGLPGAVPAARGDLGSKISSTKDAEARLKAAIAAESARIQTTADGLSQAQTRLTALQAQVNTRQQQLRQVQLDIAKARDRLTRLENRYLRASNALADNLRSSYKGDKPDFTTVVLNAHGFADLIERLDFLKRVAQHDASVLHTTRTTRTEVIDQTNQLVGLQARDRKLVSQVAGARDAASALQTALLTKQAEQLRGRAGRQAELGHVQSQLTSLKSQQAKAFAAARKAAANPSNNIAVDAGGQAQAPPGAPAAVAQVIAAGNAIAGLPYLYGGGHASFHANAYDCSGSVSYALAAAGLVSSPLDSTSFESWGEAGPGKWITVYANAGHAFMVVAGWRFDTVALAEDGTRFTRTMTGTAGFVARHPPGL